MRAIIDTEYGDIRQRFVEAKVIPLCGFEWLEENLGKKYPEQKMTIFYDGKPVITLTSKDKPTKKAVKAILDHCRRMYGGEQ